jgi:hypothetical protein
MEVAHGRHGFQHFAGHQIFVRPGGERPAIDALDADLEDALVLAGADRVGTAQFLAVEFAAEGQVLTLDEVEHRSVSVARLERDDDGVACFAPHIRHLKGMKTCHETSLPHRQMHLK